MSTHRANLPMPIQPAPDQVDREFEPLLSEPFSRLWVPPAAQLVGTEAVRNRLLGRVSASSAAGAVVHTAYCRRLKPRALGAGVTAKTLYLAQEGQPLRAGEPLRVRLIEMEPGARLTPDMLGPETQFQARHREWLVLSGIVQLGGQSLAQRDYHVTPAGYEAPTLTCTESLSLFLRESEHPAAATDQPLTVLDFEAGWPDFAPGIQRRVLWQHDGMAAMLYYAQAGAAVPEHRHGHDEECLMLQGDFFLDEMLLQPGDYQLAPAGTGHRVSATDTGVVIYAHGDLDLQFIG